MVFLTCLLNVFLLYVLKTVFYGFRLQEKRIEMLIFTYNVLQCKKKVKLTLL